MITREDQRKGMLCASRINGQWARSVITGHKYDALIIFCFDYGVKYYVKENDIMYLIANFTELPKQAIRGCLGKVRPTAGKKLWDVKAIEKCMEIISKKELWGKTLRITEV